MKEHSNTLGQVNEINWKKITQNDTFTWYFGKRKTVGAENTSSYQRLGYGEGYNRRGHM